ncbi:uncharacterized protein PHACADRAFT_253146, partial [Phanerochaete carnosa HHB-10118-sp]
MSVAWLIEQDEQATSAATLFAGVGRSTSLPSSDPILGVHCHGAVGHKSQFADHHCTVV